MLNRCIQFVDSVFRGLLVLLIAVMVVCVTWQIVSRYLLGEPSTWTEELARFLLIWIGLLGGSFAYHMKMHLGLDLLSAKLHGRAKRLHDILVHGVVIFFAATVLVGGGLQLVQLTYELKQQSAALGVPMAYIYCSLPVSGLMFIFYALVALFQQRADNVVTAEEAYPRG